MSNMSGNDSVAPIEDGTVSISVILPTFNEARRLPETLTGIRPYLDSRFQHYEVLVVDDTSTDGTPELVAAAALEWPNLRLITQGRNRGKGAAVRCGCMAATGDLIFYMDADLATPIEELDAMLPHIVSGKFGAVVGVRTYQENESRWRRILGLSLQLLAHLIVFEKAVVDSQCGFKCFTRRVARQLFTLSRVDGGMFDIELFYIMHRFNIPVFYQPVHWNNKAGSRIRILRCILFDPLDLIKIRLRGTLGRYSATAASVDEGAIPKVSWRSQDR
jgi:dolichyl-phosphate beta-glucosyltransferase